MPNKKSLEPKKRVTGWIPETLHNQVELLLPQDMLYGGPKYGVWSQLLEQLLKKWIADNALLEADHDN